MFAFAIFSLAYGLAVSRDLWPWMGWIFAPVYTITGALLLRKARRLQLGAATVGPLQ